MSLKQPPKPKNKREANRYRNKRPACEILNQELVIDHKNKIEKWGVVGRNNGGSHRFEQIYGGRLRKKILDFVLDELKQHPEIMVLGPGEGHDTALLKLELEKYGIKPEIDALNLYKGTLDKELIKKRIIRNDLSADKVFEQINQHDDSKLVKRLFENYHLVIAPKSVGVFNKSRAFSLYQVALMLKPNGRAYVELTFDFRKDLNFFKNGPNKSKMLLEVEKQRTIALRMIDSFLKNHKLNRKFEISVLKDTIIEHDICYDFFIEIKRIT